MTPIHIFIVCSLSMPMSSPVQSDFLLLFSAIKHITFCQITLLCKKQLVTTAQYVNNEYLISFLEKTFHALHLPACLLPPSGIVLYLPTQQRR